MKARRIGFAGLAFVFLLALLYSGEAVFLWILLFMLCMLVFGAINIIYTVGSVAFNQFLESGYSEKDGENKLFLEIDNNYFLPFGHLTVYFSTVESMYGGGDRFYRASVLPFGKSKTEVKIRCPYRGEYEIGFTALEVVDLFGLLRFRLPFSKFRSFKPLKLVVFPKIREIPSGFLMNRETEGPVDSRRVKAEELSSISEMRGYRDGDPLKRVHWKLSARNQKLLVKEFDGSLTADSIIVIDCTEHGLKGEAAAAFEDSIGEAATAFCKRYTDDHMQFKLITYSEDRFELEGSSPYDFMAFYEHVARIKFGGDLSIARGLKLESEAMTDTGSLVLITKAPDDDLFERLCTLSKNECRISLIIVLSQAQYDEKILRMLGELAMRDIFTLTLLPGENISHRLGGYYDASV
jgi:uncharacterized protein (DUF58 family)